MAESDRLIDFWADDEKAPTIEIVDLGCGKSTLNPWAYMREVERPVDSKHSLEPHSSGEGHG